MKIKRFIFIVGAALAAMTMVGCGNYDYFDTVHEFNKAYVYFDGEVHIIDIVSWHDYDGEQIQIKGRDGKTYLVSSFNTILVKE